MMVHVKCPNCEYVSDYIPPAKIHLGQSYATACELCGRIIYGTLPLSDVLSKSERKNGLSHLDAGGRALGDRQAVVSSPVMAHFG